MPRKKPKTAAKAIFPDVLLSLACHCYEEFVSGWLPDETSNEVWGRPVGLLVHSDGSLLITDDGARKIWRVSYCGRK